MFFFTWEICVHCLFALLRMRVERRVCYSKISQRSSYVQHCPFTQIIPIHCMFNIKEFQACFYTYYFTWENCVYCGFGLQRMSVERWMFYPKISQRSYYVEHCSCTQKLAVNSIFKTNEFQACFSTFYFTWENAYSVRLHCRECALKDGCYIRRYCSDPAMYSTVPAPKK